MVAKVFVCPLNALPIFMVTNSSLWCDSFISHTMWASPQNGQSSTPAVVAQWTLGWICDPKCAHQGCQWLLKLLVYTNNVSCLWPTWALGREILRISQCRESSDKRGERWLCNCMIRTPSPIHSQSRVYSLNFPVKWGKKILILRYFVVVT